MEHVCGNKSQFHCKSVLAKSHRVSDIDNAIPTYWVSNAWFYSRQKTHCRKGGRIWPTNE